MRTDLLDAQAAIDWAKSQLPILNARIDAYRKDDPYRLVFEPQPETGKKLIKLRDVKPLPAIINAEVGVIINSLRSSLDLVAAALARRNGKTPNADTHFPIFMSLHDFLDPRKGLESKKWLSATDRAAIKALKPYPGGNNPLVALHCLDVIRKHERLVNAEPATGMFLASYDLLAFGLEIARNRPRFENEAVLGWLNIDAPSQGQFQFALVVELREIDLGPEKSAIGPLNDLPSLIEAIIKLFDF